MLTLDELAKHLEGEWHGDSSTLLTGVASLTRAGPNDVAYYDNPVFHPALSSTTAGAVLLTAPHRSESPVNVIVVSDPFLAMAKVADLLLPPQAIHTGIHPDARVASSVRLGVNVSIGAYSVVGPDVHLADDVIIDAHVVIDSGVQLGAGSRIASGVYIHQGSRIGRSVWVDSGAVIGATPFNYIKQQGSWHPGPSVGGVIISDHVKIGANTVIDRGSLADTYIAQGVCIDNLVQIAHDAVIGENTVIAGCAAIGAHAFIGSDCSLGGACCIASSVQLADDVVISGMSTVSRSINKPGVYTSGTLVSEHERWRRNAARFRRLDDDVSRLNSLTKEELRENNE